MASILTPSYVTYGSLCLSYLEDSGVMWVMEHLDGWGAPGGTLAPAQKPRQAGAWVGDSYAAGRSMVVSGTVYAPTPALASDASDRLIFAASLASTVFTVVESGRSRFMNVRRDGEVLITWSSAQTFTYSVQVFAPDPRKLSAPLAATTGEFSTSGGLVIPTVVTVNLSASPGFEAGLPVGFAASTPSGGTWVTSNPAVGEVGTYAGRFTNTVAASTSASAFRVDALVTALVGGNDFYAQFRVKVSAPVTARARVASFTDLAGTLGGINTDGTDVVLVANAWTTVSVSGTMGAGVLSEQLSLRIADNMAVGVTIDIDSKIVKKGIPAATGFDGDTAPSGTTTYGWSGAIGASVSMQYVGGLTVPFSINSTIISGLITLTNTGNEVGAVVARIDGPCQGPVITHTSPSGAIQVFSLTGLSLGAGEWLIIDMEKRTVLAQGVASRSAYVTSRAWSGFDPGVNSWTFSAGAYDAGALLTITTAPANK